ncbi:MAG: phosphoglycerate kinase, partial [Burkholderiaceae bacterium]
MMHFKRLTDLIQQDHLRGKRVLIRSDLNAPLDDAGHITEETRLRASVPAIQAALGAGLPKSTVCTTVNKVCGSGMRAVMSIHDTLVLGAASVAIAGGMESMSNAPYLLARARAGYRIGHNTVYDHMMLDGLEDAY